MLAFDARGHGDSGGLIGIDGPKEVADVRPSSPGCATGPDVADARIGGWGVSYGGGAAWNSLAAGVPWAALEISISWTDLLQALAPQGLAKTGVIAGLLGARPEARRPRGVRGPRRGVPRRPRGVRPFAAARSSISALKGVRTPVFLMQGRRDFAFGLDQAKRAYRALSRPEAALDRPPRPRPVVGRRRGHAGDARRGRALVRPLPARRHGRALSRSPWRSRRSAGAASRGGSPGCRRSSSRGRRRSATRSRAAGDRAGGRYRIPLPPRQRRWRSSARRSSR